MLGFPDSLFFYKSVEEDGVEMWPHKSLWFFGIMKQLLRDWIRHQLTELTGKIWRHLRDRKAHFSFAYCISMTITMKESSSISHPELSRNTAPF